MMFRFIKKVIKWLPFLNKQFTLKSLLLFIVFCTLISLTLFYSTYSNDYNRNGHLIPSTKFQCYSLDHNKQSKINLNYLIKNQPNYNQLNGNKFIKSETRILVLLENQNSKFGRLIVELLESIRFKFDLKIADKNLLSLTSSNNKAKYSLIVFENYEKYLKLNKWNLQSLNKYCIKYNVGLIGFLLYKESKQNFTFFNKIHLTVNSNIEIQNYHLNSNSDVFKLTKPGSIIPILNMKKKWLTFKFNSSTYSSISNAFKTNTSTNQSNILNIVIKDSGELDNIRKILFGYDLSFWLHKLIFIDALSYLSNGKFSLPLERYIQIDIDDIFVGEQGIRLKESDVLSLISAQEKFSKFINGFKFNLGFSGKYFHKGTHEENLGDDLLLKNVDKFRWFSHMWAHSQPHLFQNISNLKIQMQLNKNFANKYGIPTNSGYSVAPHHSGVYPVHEPLYEAWKKVWNIQVTSTEEYPHLRPSRFRKGFIHQEIKVLPRQTCGLYTHTIFMNKYPDGKVKLDSSIFGGEFFFLFIFNPINVFMTHMSNYANDRLALYVFESVIKFIQCWTNLKLYTIKPVELANKYFSLYPKEINPIWTNPCYDKRHYNIWSTNKTCDQFPKFLIVGPQKTGTTALHTFLSLHPSIQSNYPSENNFEELQFFNSLNYFKGIDWYIGHFPASNKRNLFLFEKSANYFEGELVPMRAHALLPNAKIIIILLNPIKRAYSWYQHIRSHNDITALNYSFYDVITVKDHASKSLKTLRNRCLNPGCYAPYMEQWLKYYSVQQLIILDGDQLKQDPVSVLAELQLQLKIEPFLDYSKRLSYNAKKRFFCAIYPTNQTNDNHKINLKLNQVNQSNTSTPQMKCLGKSKGRNYEEMDQLASQFLQKYYISCNIMLFKLLTRLKVRIPAWLNDFSHPK